MTPLVALLTDFGLADPYVGQLKATLLSDAPTARIVDISHDVAPHNIAQAAFFLAASQVHFPEGTLFVAVVDPGVGTARRIVFLQKGSRNFLLPDNGLAGLLLAQPGPARAFAVHSLLLRSASPTFHGRDVFAPVAARFLNGEAPHSLGDPLDMDSLVRLPHAEPRLEANLLHTLVLHVDRFGNCVLGLPCEVWARTFSQHRAPSLAVPAARPLRPATTYAELDPDQIGLIAGSQGYYELAASQASAARMLGLTPGAPVTISLHPAP